MPKDSPKKENEDKAAKVPWWMDFLMTAIRILLVVLLFWLLEPYLGVIGVGVVVLFVFVPLAVLFSQYVYPGHRLRRR